MQSSTRTRLLATLGATHVLHLCHDISSWSLVQFPVFTGINDDPIEQEHDPNNQWEAGGRVRGWDQLPEALATRPPYVLAQVAIPRWMKPRLEKDYDLVFSESYLKLFRRRDLAPRSGASAGPRCGFMPAGAR